MTNKTEWSHDDVMHIIKYRQQYEQKEGGNEKMGWSDFANLLKGGESRNRPGVAVDFILVADHDNTEMFYSEWPATDDDDQTEKNLKSAYEAYHSGESEYIV